MKKFKSLVLAVIGLLCCVSVSAHDFEVDGIYYNITSSTDMTVGVTYRGEFFDSYLCEYSGAVNIPESVTYNGKTYNVTSIGDEAFYLCSSLTSVEIGNSVTSIGDDAFSSCSSLTSIVVAPNNPKYDSRDNCNAIIESESNTLIAGCQNSTIPNSVTSIGAYAFAYCSSLTSVEIPNSVTSIGDYAFVHCSSLRSVKISNSVTSIGIYAFYGCSSLTSVEIGNSVTSIGGVAFAGCSSLVSLVVASGNPIYDSREGCNAIVKTSSNELIAGCKSTIIPNSVTSIGNYAFYGCPSLTSVEIPNSVTWIADGAFSYCSSLTSLVVAPDNPIYDSREGCNAIIKTSSNELIAGCKSTIIPNSVTSIGNYAFYGCSGLTSVEIPNSVTSIGNIAFYICSSLTSVEIPNSVTSIGNYAFYGCSGVTRLSCYAKVPPTCGYGVFGGIDKEKCVLQVPGSSLAAYRQADKWKEFLFIEDVLTLIGGVIVGDAVPATADVYSTNGMLIKRNAELKNLKHELPAGIYIIGGKKVWVK